MRHAAQGILKLPPIAWRGGTKFNMTHRVGTDCEPQRSRREAEHVERKTLIAENERYR